MSRVVGIPTMGLTVGDADLKDVLRALVGEVERLTSRVDCLAADNRFLRFELAQISLQMNRASPRGQSERRAALLSELALSPHDTDAVAPNAPEGGTYEEQLAALGQRLFALETQRMEPGGREDGAFVFAKCLSCQQPSASKRETSPDPRVPHGRPFVQRPGASPGRPGTAPPQGVPQGVPQGSFRLGAAIKANQLLSRQEQTPPGQGEGAVVHVGRRSGSFGVEKIRPRP